MGPSSGRHEERDPARPPPATTVAWGALDRWEAVAPRLALRLRSGLGPTGAPALRAEVVIELAGGLVVVTGELRRRWHRSRAEVASRAAALVWDRPVLWAETAVTAGPDAGSRLVVVTGGACTTGLLAAALVGQRVPPPAGPRAGSGAPPSPPATMGSRSRPDVPGPAPPRLSGDALRWPSEEGLALAVTDDLLVVATPPAGAPIRAWRSLAHRLGEHRALVEPRSSGPTPLHRRVLRYHPSGRLAIFEAEDT